MAVGHQPFGALPVAPETLRGCMLVTTTEPCAMHAATPHWANIGHLECGTSEHRLLQPTGNRAENPTLEPRCRTEGPLRLLEAPYPQGPGVRHHVQVDPRAVSPAATRCSMPRGPKPPPMPRLRRGSAPSQSANA
jgi:tRNA(Arg) A34 adenosine deaminase TadA